MLHFLLFLLLSLPVCALAQDELEGDLKRFLEVYDLVKNRAADPINPAQALYQGAIPGMLRTLDPHSSFLDPDQYESLKEMQRSTEKGFGSVVSLAPGRVIVLQTLPGSPSARSGLAPGDEIVAVNNYSLSQLSLEQLVALLGQSRRQKAELMVKRPGLSRLIPMTMIPAEMADPGVDRTYFLRPGIAYIKIANFESSTAEELHAAVEKMGGDQLKGLVLDLRNNPGGLIEAAVKIAAFFLKPKQRILWIRGRDGPQEEVRVPEFSKPFEFPLAVLIDFGTASAAELVAGALQDHGRATVIGQRSFGKGLVQSVFDLSQGTAVALTTAQYLTPNDRSIQRPLGDCRVIQLTPCVNGPESSANNGAKPVGGIEPDVIVPPRGYTRLEAAIEGTNSFLDFVKQYLLEHPGIAGQKQPSAQMLNDFQLFLSERRIRPGLSEWSATLEFIRNRLQQEVLNLTVGVAKGDELEARRDPQIQAAIQALPGG